MDEPELHAVIPILRISSIEAALPIYDALGFSVAWQHQLDPEGPRLAAVQQGSVELYLTEHPVAPPGGVIYLKTNGVDALVARARSLGLDPSFGPEDRPWGEREAYFTDVDGNVLRFGESLETADVAERAT
jgi:catechol 2,3-dioxygenase-like lactoylglutathione lyase family enzyme